MEGEQPAASDSTITEQSAVQSAPDHDGDVSMEEGDISAEPGSAIAEQFAIQRESDGDDVHEALSPGLSKMMDVSTPAQEATTPLATGSYEKQDPPPMLLATELGFDVIQQADEWALPGTKRDTDLNRFQNQLLLAQSVTVKIGMCHNFFKRMADYRAKVTKALEVQRGALTSSTDTRMPDFIVAAHKLLVDEYQKVEAHVKETVKNLGELRDTIKDLQKRAEDLANNNT